MERTREPQYQNCLEIRDSVGLSRLGLMSNQTWYDDPRRLLFVMARHKFVAKMFSGLQNVLEVGCADAFATRLVLQEVGAITAVDFDPIFVQDVRNRMDERWRFDVREHNLLEGPVAGRFDGAYSLDVIEHIPEEDELQFVSNMVDSLSEHGIAIIGCPSLESQQHASPPSRAGHVNCKTGTGLKQLMSSFFHHVFIFSMNDEVVHTGFQPMAHYLLALCTNKKERRQT